MRNPAAIVASAAHRPSPRTRAWIAAAVAGGGQHVAECAAAIGSWDELAALWELGWLGTVRASQRLQGAGLRARLHALANAMRPVGGCGIEGGPWANLRPGDQVLAHGSLVAVAARDGDETDVDAAAVVSSEADLWAPHRAGEVGDVDASTREGRPDRSPTQDHRVRVILAGSVLVGAAALDPGAAVVVLGHFDRVVNPEGAASGPRQPPTMSVLRSGATLPLVLLARGSDRRGGNVAPGEII